MYKYAESHNSSSDLRIFLSAVFHIASFVCIPFLVKGTVNGNIYACGLLLLLTAYYSVRLFRHNKIIGVAFFVMAISGIVLGIYNFGLLSQYKNAKVYLEEEQKFCKDNTYETLKLKSDSENSRIIATHRICLEKEQALPEICNTQLNHATSLNEVKFGNNLLRLSNCANSLVTKEKNVDRIKKNIWVQFWLGLHCD